MLCIIIILDPIARHALLCTFYCRYTCLVVTLIAVYTPSLISLPLLPDHLIPPSSLPTSLSTPWTH
ncbi:hypothetical protein BD310DRAFT_941799 [Dichomitus squalens]|uniref:Uncharacterized protein n=1 Tax=Dichomitus squalens TaxID=114155 RepID=A0A4Q9PFG4_9APHY|nr:hypothetical protein BD310DRAFT_941799 [Dichomitus squalens]